MQYPFLVDFKQVSDDVDQVPQGSTYQVACTWFGLLHWQVYAMPRTFGLHSSSLPLN